MAYIQQALVVIFLVFINTTISVKWLAFSPTAIINGQVQRIPMGKLDTITSSADFMSDPNTYDTVYLIACDCKTNADADKDDIESMNDNDSQNVIETLENLFQANVILIDGSGDANAAAQDIQSILVHVARRLEAWQKAEKLQHIITVEWFTTILDTFVEVYPTAIEWKDKTVAAKVADLALPLATDDEAGKAALGALRTIAAAAIDKGSTIVKKVDDK